MTGPISQFIEKNYHHFNASALKDAAVAYKAHVDKGGKMLVTLAGAASTAEIGISLAEMIRQDKVHAISTTGANLEEDIFHLVAAKRYVKVPHWRHLSPQDDQNFWETHLNRVTDCCIPEAEAFRVLEGALVDVWEKADKSGERYLPHEFWYQIIDSGVLKENYQKDPKDSWLLAACEKKLPIFVPGAEDSTTGNFFAGRVLLEQLKATTMKSGMEYMAECMKWYMRESKKANQGIFVLGGGISADFVQCVIPTCNQDFRGVFEPVPTWDYLCQITDSTTSYGNFSSCTPTEKLTWGKLSKEVVEKRSFTIESDYTIVAPLIFAYVMGL